MEQNEEPINISSILSEKAMIVRLATSGWSGRITDKIATEELIEGKNASRDAASVTKALINKEHLKRIREATSGMKKYHNECSLPWDNNGGRLLPSTEFNAYTMKFRESQRDLDAAVTEFIQNYPGYISEAEGRLGDLFSTDDYPPAQEIETKFSLDSAFEKVPESGDFRVDIPEHEQVKIRKQIEERVESKHADAMKRLWTRMFRAVEHMNTKLSEEDGIFRNTLIGNIEQLVEILPALNILGDETLTEMTQELKDKLCGFDPDDLRKNDVLRSELAGQSKEVMDKIVAVGSFFEAASPQVVETEADAMPVTEGTANGTD